MNQADETPRTFIPEEAALMESVLYPIDLEHLTYEECPILHALNIVGQKWKLPVLWYLHEKSSIRYAELKEKIPSISNMMLSRCLQQLEEDGLIERRDFHTVAKRVEYCLSECGKQMLPALNALYQWGEAHIEWEKKTGRNIRRR